MTQTKIAHSAGVDISGPLPVHYLIQGVIAILLIVLLTITQDVLYSILMFAGMVVLSLTMLPIARLIFLVALLPFAHAGIGLDFLPGFGIYNIYAFLVILVFLFSLPLRLPSPRFREPVLQFALIMMCGFIPSILTSVDLAESVKAFVNLSSNILIAYAVYMILIESDNIGYIKLLSIVYIVVALSASIYGIYQTLTSASIFALFTGRAYFRLFGDANYFASYILIAIPLAMGYLFRDSRFIEKAAYAVVMFLLTTAIIASVSRSALLTLIIIILLFMLFLFRYQQGTRKIVSVGVILIFMGITGVLLFTDIGSKVIDLFTLSQRLETVVGGRDASFGQRWTILGIGWDMARTNPVVGTGFGAFEKTFSAYQGALLTTGLERSTHNTLLRIFAETGIIGLAGGLLFIGSLIYRIGRMTVRCKSYNDKILIFSFFAGLISFLVMCLTLDMLFEPHFWVITGITLALVYYLEKKMNAGTNQVTG